MKQPVFWNSLLFSTLLFVVVSTGCGENRSTLVSVTGRWFWAENVSGFGLAEFYHVSLNQAAGTVAGLKNLSDGTTCAMTGTITGRTLQLTAASPCNQTFSLTISADNNSLRGTGLSGQLSLTVRANRDMT